MYKNTDFNSNLVCNTNPISKPNIIFCIPGNSFSDKFFASWTDTITSLTHKYNIKYINKFSSQVNFARTLCLGANVLNGPDQIPFDGNYKYDALIWLDSDMVFTSKMIDYLIFMTLNKHKVFSGIYAMDGGTQLCCVQDWDIEVYKKTGSFKFISVDEGNELIQNNKHIQMCAYAGMGCMGIRYGVFEDSRLKYPWFFRNISVISDDIVEGASEDVSFIRNMIDAGIIDGVMVDLSLRFGHEKKIVY